MMSKGGTLHNEIKRQGRKILLEKGFKEDEISEEYEVRIGRRKLIVDVVGISGNRSVAIECGGVSDPDKISILRSYFDEVIHLPYLDKTLVSEIEGYKREIRSKDRTIEDLRENIEKMRKDESKEKPSHKIKANKEPEIISRLLREDSENTLKSQIEKVYEKGSFDERLEKVAETLKTIRSTLEKMFERKETEAEKEELG